jgi:Retrotransposon gag protein
VTTLGLPEPITRDSWTQFKATLTSNFKDVGSKDEAIGKLQRMKQGKSTTDEFNTKFRILVQKAGLDEQENATLLMQFYAQGI